MPCLTPISIRIGDSNSFQAVPCGKCAQCLSIRRLQWFIRLKEENKFHLESSFITLTYTDIHLEKINGIPSVNKRTLQNFIKRLRHEINFRYYAVGEYGNSTYRPHYHIIAFGIPHTESDIILKTWGLGNVSVMPINDANINYVCKYHVNKTNYPINANPSFCIMSTKPAIGSKYLEISTNYHKGILNHAYYILDGKKVPLPRYYRDKLYSKEEKIIIRQNLDKNFDLVKEVEKYNAEHQNSNYFEYQKDKIKNENFQFKQKSKKSKL